QFREVIGARFERRLPVQYVFQELTTLPPGFSVPAGRSKPWGTTHAILMAEDAVREPFAAINADDFYGADSYRSLAAYLSSGSPDYAMVGFVLRNTLSDFGSVARGVCQTDAAGHLTAITELTKLERDGASAKNTEPSGYVSRLSGNEPVSMNFWGFTPAVFPQLRQVFTGLLEKNGQDQKAECYIPNTVGDLIKAGQARVKVLPTNASWFGVTYRDDRPRVVESIRQLIARGDYPEKLWP